jgi:hypothetical protein
LGVFFLSAKSDRVVFFVGKLPMKAG